MELSQRSVITQQRNIKVTYRLRARTSWNSVSLNSPAHQMGQHVQTAQRANTWKLIQPQINPQQQKRQALPPATAQTQRTQSASISEKKMDKTHVNPANDGPNTGKISQPSDHANPPKNIKATYKLRTRPTHGPQSTSDQPSKHKCPSTYMLRNTPTHETSVRPQINQQTQVVNTYSYNHTNHETVSL